MDLSSSTAPSPALEGVPASLHVLANGTLCTVPSTAEFMPAARGDAPWLRVYWGSHERMIPAMLRALQALASLARSDQRAWTNALMRLWPTSQTTRWVQQWEQQQQPQQQCGHVDPTPVMGLCIVLCLMQDLSWLRRGYLASEMTVTHPQTSDAPSVAPTPMPTIPIHFSVRIPGILDSEMRRIEHMTRPARGTVAMPFRVTSIEILASGFGYRCVRRLAAMARRGVVVTSMPYLEAELSIATAANVVTSLQALLPSQRSSSDFVPTQIDRVQIAPTNDASWNRQTTALLSALADSPSVSELGWFHNENTSETLVRWVAFAFFSTRAPHSLTKLQMYGSLTDAAHIQAFRDVVLARDPVAELFHEHRSSVETLERIRIAASRFCLGGPGITVAECARHTALRVMSYKDDWWSVLLPGSGQAWVHTSDAVVSQSTDQMAESPIRPRAAIRELELQGSVELFPWLAAVFNGVEQLTLGHWNERAQWHELVERFPRLTTLRLRFVTIDQLMPLYATDASTRYWQSLETLELTRVSIENGNVYDELMGLLKALGENEHHTTKTLRSLTLNIDCEDPLKYPPLLEAVRAMLCANTQLRDIRLSLPSAITYPTETRDAILAQCGVLNHERLAPLGLRHKCALLSVLTSQQAAAASQPFDSRVVATIFRFAATCRPRCVELSEW